MDELRGMVLRYEGSSIHDGPGLRTVMFLKGCPMKCQWCSTPESQRFGIEMGFLSNRCNGCGSCVDQCPQKAMYREDGSVKWDREKCRACLACTKICTQGAHKKYGEWMTVREAVKILEKDEIFYFHSGGGITLSGGEVMAQPEFAAEILKRCREKGIHTAIETSLAARWETVEKVVSHADLIYADIKHMSSIRHRYLTGIGNEEILDNIKRLTKLDRESEKPEIVIRIPVIPGYNDDMENLKQTVAFCDQCGNVSKVELLAYHRLGLETYRNLGIPYGMEECRPPSEEWMDGARKKLGI